MAQLAVLTGEFIARRSREAWEWGVNDCLMTLANWVVQRHGVDPAAPWRGRYATAGEAAAVIAAAGGMPEIVDATGLPRTEQPGCGDIAVVALPLCGQCGAIVAGGGLVAVITVDRGMVLLRVPHRLVVAAWQVA